MTANASVQRRSPYPFTEEDIEFLRRKSAEHAISFLQDIRQYKEQKGLTDVPDIHFSRKFLDETMVLLEQDCAATPPSPKRRFTDIFPFKRKRGGGGSCMSCNFSVCVSINFPPTPVEGLICVLCVLDTHPTHTHTHSLDVSVELETQPSYVDCAFHYFSTPVN